MSGLMPRFLHSLCMSRDAYAPSARTEAARSPPTVSPPTVSSSSGTNIFESPTVSSVTLSARIIPVSVSTSTRAS